MRSDATSCIWLDEAQDRRFCRSVFSDFADSMFECSDEPPEIKNRQFYAALVADLTFFVEDADLEYELPFRAKVDRSGKKGYDFSYFAERYFRKLPGFLKVVGMLSDKYRYSEHINVFIEVCDSLGIREMLLAWRDMWDSPLITYPSLNGNNGAELFNEVVIRIRRDWVEKGHKEKWRRRRSETLLLCHDYQRYVDAWFDKHALIVVKRLDLNYKKENWGESTLEGAIRDLNHLCNNFRCNQIFKGMKGYIAKVEFGLGKGVHIHMIFLFDTSVQQARNHVFHTQKIGEYWVNTITKGRGEYWNCNANADDFERLGRRGIGSIHATDTARRNNLSNFVVRYLCKPDQFIRPNCNSSQRLIRRGLWPTVTLKKRGAPRKRQVEQVQV